MIRKLLARLGLLAALAFASAPLALGQPTGSAADPEAETPEAGRSASFENVTGPQVEDVPGGALMVGAYAVGWVLVLLYVGRLAALHRRTARDVEGLRLALESAARSPKE